ncbi:isochorismatase family protein [Haloactinomyces albus]|uniref:Bifunctional isochorismate lyase/aryl carrier protein n=1 Tax=Haloactinomyces albus TaxID=1352928 RepID=A0AAE4CL65_9ACTN|nr:isochorismatase family protein [Haloactinomyces albus]MDR7301960.1 bifunctional isochorismate lyase/aryl carrier protein [Haloactinomyces albus]
MSIPMITPYGMPVTDELPECRVDWRVDPRRAVVLIHDMQNYFVDFFAPGTSPRTDLVDNSDEVRRTAIDVGVPVVYTAQPGNMTREQRGLLLDVWGPGMGDEPQQRAIVGELTPRAEDTVLTKWRYSAFARSDLEGIMLRGGRDQLVICGVYAHVGCLMTACDAFTKDIQPFVVADAMADFSAEYHRMALEYMAERCARLLTTDELVRGLEKSDHGLGAAAR